MVRSERAGNDLRSDSSGLSVRENYMPAAVVRDRIPRQPNVKYMLSFA